MACNVKDCSVSNPQTPSLNENDSFLLSETFLPWDLDSLFVSTLILIISRFVDSSLTSHPAQWVEKAFSLFDFTMTSGNRIAEFRIKELRKLEEMLAEYSISEPHRQPQQLASIAPQQTTAYSNLLSTDPETTSSPSIHGTGRVGYTVPRHHQNSVTALTSSSDEGSGFGEDLTAEQIVGFAESMDIDIGGNDWLSFATIEGYHMVGAEGIGPT